MLNCVHPLAPPSAGPSAVGRRSMFYSILTSHTIYTGHRTGLSSNDYIFHSAKFAGIQRKTVPREHSRRPGIHVRC